MLLVKLKRKLNLWMTGVLATSNRTSCKLLLFSFATYYVKVMKKMMDKGNDYVKNEIERLGRLLTGDVSPKKNDEFTKRQNILRKFEL